MNQRPPKMITAMVFRGAQSEAEQSISVGSELLLQHIVENLREVRITAELALVTPCAERRFACKQH